MLLFAVAALLAVLEGVLPKMPTLFGSVPVPSPTFGGVARFAQAPVSFDAPIVADPLPDHAGIADESSVSPQQKKKPLRPHPKTTALAPERPLTGPTLLPEPATPSPRPQSEAHPVQVLVGTEPLQSIVVSTQPRSRPLPAPTVRPTPQPTPTAPPLKPEDLARLNALRRLARLDAVRRAATQQALRGEVGMHVISSDIQNESGGYAVIVVEQRLNGGTMVEVMHFRDGTTGLRLAGRHLLSETAPTPWKTHPAP